MRTPILFAISLAALACFHAGPLSTRAHALRVAMPPPQATTIAEVQTNLAAIEPQLQACGVSTSTTTPARVMVHVHAFPQGFWGVTFGAGRASTPTIGGRGTTPFERCVAQAIESRIGARTEPFTGTRPRTISRRFRLVATGTGTPPTVSVAPPTVGPITAAYTAAVRRVLASRRTQIQACFPHTPPARAARGTIRFRVEVSPNGAIHITGLGLPSHVDFANTAQCLERALDGANGPAQAGILRGEIPYQVQIDAAPAAGDPAAIPN